ncbi:MAG: hypothetical protein ACJAYG_002235 [Oceanicoccus sp.]|jgi:hypothetical protein
MFIKLYKNRAARTIFLAIFASLSFVASAILVFDVEAAVMGRFLLACVLLLAVVMVAALTVVALKVLISHLLKNRRR